MVSSLLTKDEVDLCGDPPSCARPDLEYIVLLLLLCMFTVKSPSRILRQWQQHVA